MARFSSGDFTIRYVISGFVDDVIAAQNGQAYATRKGRVLKVTHSGQHRGGVRANLISTIALFG